MITILIWLLVYYLIVERVKMRGFAEHLICFPQRI